LAENKKFAAAPQKIKNAAAPQKQKLHLEKTRAARRLRLSAVYGRLRP
jgi:hypothetical protein